jgi:hypothetical protein
MKHLRSKTASRAGSSLRMIGSLRSNITGRSYIWISR